MKFLDAPQEILGKEFKLENSRAAAAAGGGVNGWCTLIPGGGVLVHVAAGAAPPVGGAGAPIQEHEEAGKLYGLVVPDGSY